MKKIHYFIGAQKEIESFSEKSKQRIARLLEMLAEELELQPKDFKYMGSVGAGVYELRIRADKHYRIFYVAKFEEAIYVLHAFVKKTPQTARHDIEKGRERFKLLLKLREEL